MSNDTAVTPEATRSFRKVIGAKIRAGATRTKTLATTAWAWNMKIARGARKAAATVVFGGLSLVGRTTYAVVRHTARIALLALKVALSVVVAVTLVVVLVVAAAASVVFRVVRIVVYALVKVVHFVTLLLASPWLAYAGGVEALKVDWEIFAVSLKPQNWFVVDPMALQVQTLKGRTKQEDLEDILHPTSPTQPERAEAPVVDGQAPQTAGKHRTEPKGHPTPRQQKRRPRRLDPDSVPV